MGITLKRLLDSTILLLSIAMLATPLFAQQGDRDVSRASPVEGVSLRFIESNGIRMRIAEAGEGPLVLFAHGWPESWYSWRHQLQALAAAGYHAVAPDMRGYGETDKPTTVSDYDIVHTAGDMVGVLDALGEETAIMVGHDWGAIVAWNSVLLHPERFTAVIAMSVPLRPRGPQKPTERMKATYGDNFYYILYHNESGGVAEAEYDSDPRGILSRMYLSPDSPRQAPTITNRKRSAGGWIGRRGAPLGLPNWLTAADLDYYVSQFEHAGFRGGVNYYRNMDRNWEITEHLDGASIKVPALFIAGERDGVISGASADELENTMASKVSNLEVLLIPGIGHWVQQEAAEATNAAMLEFLNKL